MASKKQPTVKLHLSEDVLRRLILLSKKEGRSLNNELSMLARNAIAYHERAKGKLDTRELAALDLSEYFEPDDQE